MRTYWHIPDLASGEVAHLVHRHYAASAVLILLIGFVGSPGEMTSTTTGTPAAAIDSAGVAPAAAPGPGPVIAEGEELVYEASWWAFKLGQIRITTSMTKAEDGTLHPAATAFIDSYGNLPFVDVHSISETIMDSTLSTYSSRSIEERNNEWWVLKHHYYPESKRLIIEDSWQKTKDSPPYKPSEFDTLSVNGKLQDGLSILFFARMNLHSSKTIRVSTIVYKKLGKTTLEFTGETKTIDIDGYDHPIAVRGLRGTAEFEGLFGFSGDFEGWFTDDQAAVPVKAKLGVIIGSIELELKKWKRTGWTPPTQEH